MWYNNNVLPETDEQEATPCSKMNTGNWWNA